LLLIALAVVVRIILVAHCNFDLLQDTEHVMGLQQLRLNVLENTQNQFVEKFPSVLEELIEKGGRNFTLSFWQNRSKKTENPVTGIHFCSHLMLFKMFR
jgi:hypothetical protein